MLLTKSRIPIVATGIILLFGFFAFIITDRASADPADGPIPGGFFGNDATATTGWDWSGSGQTGKIDIFLGAGLAGNVFEIEVFVEPDTSTTAIMQDKNDPMHVQQMGGFGPFPTEQLLNFGFSTTIELDKAGPTNVGLHLMGQDVNGNPIRVLTLSAPINLGLLVPPAPPPPPPQPAATPVATTEVPTSQITAVTAPTGGVSAIVQPSAAATVTAPDGSVTAAVPAVANATTFQLVYNPTPASVPAAATGKKVIRAFELNTFNTAGIKVSLTLLRPATITVRYTSADVVAAPDNNPINLKIGRYDEANQAWTPLNTTVDLAAQTLSAKSSRFSLFGVVGVEPPPQVAPPSAGTPTATPRAPVTGDVSPGSGMLLALILAGFLLIAAGGAYLTQARRAGN